MDILRVSKGEVVLVEPHVLSPAQEGDFHFIRITHQFAQEHTQDWLAAVAKLGHPTPLEEHLSDAANLQHPSFFDAARDYDMIVFRGLEAPEPGKIDTAPSTFFVYSDALVMVHGAEHATASTALERCLFGFLGQCTPEPHSASSSQKLARTPPRSPTELLLQILNELVDRFLALRQPLTQALDKLQRDLINPRKPFRDWYSLLEIRDEYARLEGLCEEQLDAIQEWNDARLEHRVPGQASAMEEQLQVRLTDLIEHIQRVLNHAKRLESQAETTVQLHFAATSHRTSEIMRVLTVITAIFMPLTLITGVFGMNVAFPEWAKTEHAFAIIAVSMLAMALAMMAFFRAKRFIESRDRNVARRR